MTYSVDELRYLLANVEGDRGYSGPVLQTVDSTRLLIGGVRMLGAYPRDQWGDKVREMIAVALSSMGRSHDRK
jgi:hypothetical protein